MISPDLVRSEMLKSLGEWGVRYYNANKLHRAFFDLAITCSLNHSQPNPNNNDNDNENVESIAEKVSTMLKDDDDIPSDPILAIKFVLRNSIISAEGKNRNYGEEGDGDNDNDDDEDVDGNDNDEYNDDDIVNSDKNNNNNNNDKWRPRKIEHYDDTLKSFNCPYYQHKDQKSGAISYRRKKEFKKYSEAKLDPFRRFFKVETGSDQRMQIKCLQDEIFNDWIDHFNVVGNIFEALVASHLRYHTACHYCKFRNTLRWCGGIYSSWMDVVCTKCWATYEIKSKEDNEAIDRCFRRRKEFNGGSFKFYYRGSQSVPVRYLVVVGRTACPKINNNNNNSELWTYPVYIAKIDKVLPQLRSNAFYGFTKDRKGLKIASVVRIEQSTWKLWVEVPTCGVVIDDIVKDVFDEHFGEKSWETKMAQLDYSKQIIIIKSLQEKQKQVKNQEIVAAKITKRRRRKKKIE